MKTTPMKRGRSSSPTPTKLRSPPKKGDNKRQRLAESGKEASSVRAASLPKLQRPDKPVGKAWPLRELFAYDSEGEIGWGPLLADVLKERGWRLRKPCHSTMGDDPRHTLTYGIHEDGLPTVFIKELEASLRQLTPEQAFGKSGAVEEGYKLRPVPLERHGLYMMGRTSYRIPGPMNGTGRCYEREDYARVFTENSSSLPGEVGNYRMSKFPGMETALFKTNLSEAFREKDWYPVAYVLPKERNLLLEAMRKGGYWIAKPRNDYSGQGISVWSGSSPELVKAVSDSGDKPRSLVQRYLHDPLLIGGYKFHMRIHLVITSLYPELEGYVQENGQCLFATKKYTLSKHTLAASFDPPVHVTNLGLNATSENKANFFERKPVIGPGQQIRMADLERHLAKHFPGYDKEALWGQITKIAAEFVRYVSKAPSIRKNKDRLLRDRFFEILGMDLMLDKNLKVHMCEVNTEPGLDYPDKEMLGSPNPDYKKESGACAETWHDLFALMGLDAGKKQTKGSLKSWYKLDFSDA